MCNLVDPTKHNVHGAEFALDNNRRGHTVLRLSRFFGNSAQFWMNLQTRYELESAREVSAANIEREVRPHAAA